MGNGGDGRQAAERPPGEGGVRLRVRDRLGFLIYIYISLLMLLIAPIYVPQAHGLW